VWSKSNFKIFISYGDITYLLKVLNFPSNMTFLVTFNDIFLSLQMLRLHLNYFFMTNLLPLTRNYVPNMKLV
jgi:hypothetical protein